MIQGSQEWHEARLGKITGSRFADVMTEPKAKKDKDAGNLSKTAESYMYELIGERLTGQQHEFRETDSIAWGNKYEPVAREVYAEWIGLPVTEVGFHDHDEIEMVGCSSDGLVGDDGVIEIKCPFTTKKHIEYGLSGYCPKEHYAQCIGQLFVRRNRKWCDFVSYDPRIENLNLAMFVRRVWRTKRQPYSIKTMEVRIRNFALKIEETMQRLYDNQQF